ncbi:hypothetical protein VSU19_19890 [Verrucomicrobiales bacterium BCK34]|nr:hypothetical protein [Verrucomicrobiales bacterium BCK34]
MEKNPTKNEFDRETAVAGFLESLTISFAEHFKLDASSADWKANLLIKMMESSDFISELIEEQKVEDAKPCPQLDETEEQQGVDPHLMVDRMAGGLRIAFEDAFGSDRMAESDYAGYVMEHLESTGIVDELMEEFPVTKGDMIRFSRHREGNPSSGFLPENAVRFLCEFLLQEASDDVSRVRAKKRSKTLLDLHEKVLYQFERRQASSEEMRDLSWALRQLVNLTQLNLPGGLTEAKTAMSVGANKDMVLTESSPATTEGKALLEALGELPSD